MTKTGHRATALALGVAGIIYLGMPNGIGWLIGCIFGASAPDYLEFHYGEGPRGHRTLFVHRTWTHQPFFWVAAIAAYLHYEFRHTAYHYGVLGWLYSALLHLCMDFLTPMGIPLGFPWSKRTSLHLYRTGKSEIPFIATVWLGLVGPLLWPFVFPFIQNALPLITSLFSTLE
jgi:inner membrane protein